MAHPLSPGHDRLRSSLTLHGNLRTVEREQRMMNHRAELVPTFGGEALDMRCERAGPGDGLRRRSGPRRGTRIHVLAGNRPVFKADLERRAVAHIEHLTLQRFLITVGDR